MTNVVGMAVNLLVVLLLVGPNRPMGGGFGLNGFRGGAGTAALHTCTA